MMTPSEVTDDMLMAFVDGELDAQSEREIERLAITNADIAARIGRMRETRQAVSEVFAAIRREPVPEHLTTFVLGGGAKRVEAKRPPAFRRAMLPIAASLLVVAGLGGYWVGRLAPVEDGQPRSFLAVASGGAVLDALAQVPAGVPVPVAAGEHTLSASVIGTYAVDAGYCRLYEVSDAAQNAARGVACLAEDGWHVPLSLLDSASGNYRPASAATTESIDAFLDGIGASADIGLEAEETLIARDWRP